LLLEFSKLGVPLFLMIARTLHIQI
jgi:hypothetical protein